jgi:hypothetical protein
MRTYLIGLPQSECGPRRAQPGPVSPLPRNILQAMGQCKGLKVLERQLLYCRSAYVPKKTHSWYSWVLQTSATYELCRMTPRLRWHLKDCLASGSTFSVLGFFWT